jgi:hypothetical protein
MLFFNAVFSKLHQTDDFDCSKDVFVRVGGMVADDVIDKDL